MYTTTEIHSKFCDLLIFCVMFRKYTKINFAADKLHWGNAAISQFNRLIQVIQKPFIEFLVHARCPKASRGIKMYVYR